MRYWWVNHKQTRKQEVGGDYLWSPKARADGGRNQFYDNMVRARPGDIVFSFADGHVGAWGVVAADAVTAPKPTEFGNAGQYWSNEGWLLDVAFREAAVPVSTVAYKGLIGPLLPARYSPIRENGHGNQGAYLAEISDQLGVVLLQLLGATGQVKDFAANEHEIQAPAVKDIEIIQSQLDIPETQKQQLIASRIGQGLFRKRALLLGGQCRVTGVADKRLLRASHIKPWRESSNFERLDGANGLMLSPHIDALFDQELLTFSAKGDILVSKELDPEVIHRWSISKPVVNAGFLPEQEKYLGIHRERVAKSGVIQL